MIEPPTSPQWTSPRSVVMQRQHVLVTTHATGPRHGSDRQHDEQEAEMGEQQRLNASGKRDVPPQKRMTRLVSRQRGGVFHLRPSRSLPLMMERDDLQDHSSNSVDEELHVLHDGLNLDVVSLTHLEEAFVHEYDSLAHQVARAFAHKEEGEGGGALEQEPQSKDAHLNTDYSTCSPYSTDDCDSITTTKSSTESSEVSWRNYEAFQQQLTQVRRSLSCGSWGSSSLSEENKNNEDENFCDDEKQNKGPARAMMAHSRTGGLTNGESMGHSIPLLDPAIVKENEDDAVDDSSIQSLYSSDDCDSLDRDDDGTSSCQQFPGSTITSSTISWSHCESYEQELASADGSSCIRCWEEESADEDSTPTTTKVGQPLGHHCYLAATCKTGQPSVGDSKRQQVSDPVASTKNDCLRHSCPPASSTLVAVSPLVGRFQNMLQKYGSRKPSAWWLLPAAALVAWETLAPNLASQKHYQTNGPPYFFHHFLLLGVCIGDEEMSSQR